MTGPEVPASSTPTGDELYEAAPCALVTIRRAGEVVRANAMFRNLIGARTLESTPFHRLLRPGDRIYWETHLGPLLDLQGKVSEIALTIETERGPVPVFMSAHAAAYGIGDTIDIAILPAHDRRSYENELIEARKRAERSEADARVLAETLQRSLLPPSLPELPGVSIGATYRPAGSGAEVGGDFYDFFRVTPSDWLIAMGDVCGKGAPAASVTALVRYTLRGAAMETDSLLETLTAVDTTLRLERSRDLCTALLLRISTDDSRCIAQLVAAGHPLPMLVTEAGEVRPVGRVGTMLGAFEDTFRHVEEVELTPGSSLVLFTDGVVEARNGSEFFGDDRLLEVLAQSSTLSAPELAAEVADAAAQFQQGPPRDDVAVVVLQNPR